MEIFLIFLAGAAIGFYFLGNHIENKLNKNLDDLREAMQAMLFLKLEEVENPQGEGKIFLAFDLKTNRFMGQDFTELSLYRSLFERKPHVEMLWVHSKDTGDNMVRVDRKEILVDNVAA